MITMLDCIRRVPERIRWMNSHRMKMFEPLEKCWNGSADWREVVLVGCGTSNTSAITARYPMQKLCGIRVTPTLPSELLHEDAVENPEALYVFISQTGTSVLTREALRWARGKGYATVAVTESDRTSIAGEADAFLDMGCGNEEYPMRTIGYSTSVYALILLGLWIGEKQGHISGAEREEFLQEALDTADRIGPVIDRTLTWLETERRQMMRSDCLVFTGSGALFGVAMEAAVKVWETPQVISIAYELEEGLHGANYGYTQRHCVIVLNDGGVDNGKARALCAFMKNEKNNGFLIGANPLDDHDFPLESGYRLDCLVFAAVVQTMAYQLALYQGRDLLAPHDNRVMYSYFDTHNENGTVRQ